MEILQSLQACRLEGWGRREEGGGKGGREGGWGRVDGGGGWGRDRQLSKTPSLLIGSQPN